MEVLTDLGIGYLSAEVMGNSASLSFGNVTADIVTMRRWRGEESSR